MTGEDTIGMTSSALDHLVPPIGKASSEERMLRANWISSLERSPNGAPLLWPEFVARQGRSVRIIDVREEDELVGPLGHIAGCDWIPRERAASLVERLDPDAMIVIVSRAGDARARSHRGSSTARCGSSRR